jgi:polysaccharide pyruvyl transferase WcaK-like protein
VDDRFFTELAEAIPDLQLYDRTQYSLEQICAQVASCSGVIAARLHVLRMAKLLRLPFNPLVYQEKISTFLDACSDELS